MTYINDFIKRNKRAIGGYLFISPFIIGFILFVLRPFIQSIIFSFSKLEVTSGGMNLTFVGLENFYHSLLIDADFLRILTETLIRTLVDIPAVIIFAFFAAVLLNQKFKGRLLARIIFFIPLILTSGVVLEIQSGDIMHQFMESGEQLMLEANESILAGPAVKSFLYELKLPLTLVDYVINAMDRIPDIINSSAIPILIFMAGLQSIPASFYEAAAIEGATGWESFWKITFPLISPLFLTNVVFIVINSFTAADNRLISFIKSSTWGGAGYGISVAMSWLYFLGIIMILIVTIGIISKNVFYME